MSANCKFERSLLDFDEFETIRVTHHPPIYEVASTDLQDIRSRLRNMRDKERTLARQKRREARGKAEPRGGDFPGTAEKPAQRKQVFGAALKRVNKELKRRRNLEAQAANVEAAQQALALKLAANFVHHPAADDTAGEGAQALLNLRRRRTVHAAKIGSISKAIRVAQAVRDAKN